MKNLDLGVCNISLYRAAVEDSSRKKENRQSRKQQVALL